jgi:hypothetical protein
LCRCRGGAEVVQRWCRDADAEAQIQSRCIWCAANPPQFLRLQLQNPAAVAPQASIFFLIIILFFLDLISYSCHPIPMSYVIVSILLKMKLLAVVNNTSILGNGIGWLTPILRNDSEQN